MLSQLRELVKSASFRRAIVGEKKKRMDQQLVIMQICKQIAYFMFMFSKSDQAMSIFFDIRYRLLKKCKEQVSPFLAQVLAVRELLWMTCAFQNLTN